MTEEPSVDASTSTAAVQKAVGSSPAKEQVNEGIALYEQGDYKGALSKFEKATEADPALAAAWSDKGCALGRLGERDAALEAFNKALEIEPDNREAREGKDLCLRMLGSSQKAS
jgi:Flp pilus assembly protein TadD